MFGRKENMHGKISKLYTFDYLKFVMALLFSIDAFKQRNDFKFQN